MWKYPVSHRLCWFVSKVIHFVAVHTLRDLYASYMLVIRVQFDKYCKTATFQLTLTLPQCATVWCMLQYRNNNNTMRHR